MNKIFILLLTLLFSSNVEKHQQSESATTYYFIRHAEKDRSNKNDRDPQLTEEGQKRAQNWATILEDVKFNAVYSTPYARTMQTARPVATQQDLRIDTYDPRDLYNSEFQKATKGKTVLVVGHSNTTPQFVNAILKNDKYKDIDDSENGALFIVKILPDGSITDRVEYHN
ncbi:MAG: histidine phosphatase family protein [Christiangramia sp.]|uniref:SixA phosphatase family protein n=1 Tax=Christiangramia sp. TaxID=1931228 RepID=UPI003242A451